MAGIWKFGRFATCPSRDMTVGEGCSGHPKVQNAGDLCQWRPTLGPTTAPDTASSLTRSRYEVLPDREPHADAEKDDDEMIDRDLVEASFRFYTDCKESVLQGGFDFSEAYSYADEKCDANNQARPHPCTSNKSDGQLMEESDCKSFA